MTLYRIPTPGETAPSRTQRVVLDGREYLFTFDWRALESRWYLDVGTTEGESLISGIKLCLGANLLRRSQDERMPPGLLFLVAAIGSDDPGLDALGSRVALMYASAT